LGGAAWRRDQRASDELPVAPPPAEPALLIVSSASE